MFAQNTSKFLKYYGKGKMLKFGIFFLMSLVSGFLELMGVALIYPFILVIISPNTVNNYKIYDWAQSFFPNINESSFALILGGIIFGLFIFKNIFMILILLYQTKFTTYWKRDIAKTMMKYYTFASYKDLMSISPEEKNFFIGTIIPYVIDGFIVRGLNIITNSIIILMIILFLLIKFPMAAIITSIFVIVSMSVQNKLFKKKVAEIASKIASIQSTYNKILLENIYNIKGIKILSAEEIFYNKYLSAENNLKKIQVNQTFYATIPPYIVEIFVVLSVLLLGLIISYKNGGDNTVLVASFAVIAAALFRIAPALNRIQSAIISINASRNFVRQAIKRWEVLNPESIKDCIEDKVLPITFNNKIVLQNVSFSYVTNKPILKNINLTINKGDFIGIVGLSGAGKSTLADILMGLLPPDSGNILIDGNILNRNQYMALRKKIGYVAQEITVFDMSFMENVIWGSDGAPDEKRVVKVLKDVKLYDFITQNYDSGINAKPFIGTTGLSQGQKQRLSIARALYRNPEIILLDEATSSLDVVCENEITDVLKELQGEKTIVAIAHRLSTLRSCNKLVYMKDGEIVDIGTFSELSAKYEDFKTIIKLSKIEDTENLS